MIKDNRAKKGPAYYCHTRWGRVGEFGQQATVGPQDLYGAHKEFTKKFRDKSGLNWEERNEEPKKYKYVFIEKSYEGSDDEEGPTVKKEEEEEEAVKEEVESKLSKPLQRLVELIFNENHFNSVLEGIGYNQQKLPLGKLGKSTITKGFEYLKELSALIRHPKLAQNKYQVPQDEVSPLPRALAMRNSCIELTDSTSRQSKTTPTATTQRSHTVSAATAPPSSTTTTSSKRKSPCSTP